MQKALSESGLASIRFFSATQLTLSTGEDIAALCVMGDTPREVPHGVLEHLKFPGDAVIRTLEDAIGARWATKLGSTRNRPPSRKQSLFTVR